MHSLQWSASSSICPQAVISASSTQAECINGQKEGWVGVGDRPFCDDHDVCPHNSIDVKIWMFRNVPKVLQLIYLISTGIIKMGSSLLHSEKAVLPLKHVSSPLR